MDQRTARSERSRDRLIQAASEALVAGDGNFELQKVAQLAGVSVGLPSHRFGSKAGLVAAVVDRFYDEVGAVISLAGVTEQDWARREQLRLSRLIGFLYSNPMAGIIISALSREPEVAAVENARWSDLITLTASNIKKGQQRGQLPKHYDAETLSALICGGVRHAVGQALASRPRPSQARLTGQIWSWISSGLALPAAEAKP